MTNVVIVSGFRIFPVRTGGQVRTSGIAKALARMGYEVLIYSLSGRVDDYPARGGPFRRDRIEPCLVEETNLGLGFGLVQTLTRRLKLPRFLQYQLLSRGIIPRRGAEALQRADVILSDFSYVPRVPGPWAKTPWFLISHQLEHQLLAQQPGFPRLFTGWMRDVESHAPGSYSDILAVAEEDREFFRARDPTHERRLPIVRCAVDSRDYLPVEDTRRRIRSELGLSDEDRLLVFAGSAYLPNIEAFERLRAFAHERAEFLARERVYFLVLGSVSERAYREGALIVTGRVPEVIPYFSAGDAGLNPITRGAGSNIKLFEYLAARLPVISTPFGARGTELEADVDYLPFSPEDLESAIARFIERGDRSFWSRHAEQVWARRRRSCDISEAMRAALETLPNFPRP